MSLPLPDNIPQWYAAIHGAVRAYRSNERDDLVQQAALEFLRKQPTIKGDPIGYAKGVAFGISRRTPIWRQKKTHRYTTATPNLGDKLLDYRMNPLQQLLYKESAAERKAERERQEQQHRERLKVVLEVLPDLPAQQREVITAYLNGETIGKKNGRDAALYNGIRAIRRRLKLIKKPRVIRGCDYCGRSMEQTRAGHVLCSPACRRKSSYYKRPTSYHNANRKHSNLSSQSDMILTAVEFTL